MDQKHNKLLEQYDNDMDNRWVRVKYHDIITETEKAILVLIGETEHWLPRKLTSIRRNYVHLPVWLADEKDIKTYQNINHIPAPLEVQENQDPIDELRFDPRKSG